MGIHRIFRVRVSSRPYSQARVLFFAVLLIASFPSSAAAGPYPAPDPGFGNDGIVPLDSYTGDWDTMAAVQPDGRIVIGTESALGHGLLRLNEDGSVDTSFGKDGWVAVPPKPFGDEFASLADLVIQPDGSIITGWNALVGDVNAFAFFRVDSNGSLDIAFGEAGQVLFDGFAAGWSLDRLGGVALQADGKIVAAGNQLQLVGDEFVPIGIEDGLVFRLLPDGSLDESFGTDGVVIFDAGDSDGFADVVIAPTGELVVGGYVGEGWDRELESEPTSMTVVRLTGDGQVDTSFGDSGSVALNVLDRDGTGEVAIHGQDKILAIGGGGDEFGPQRTVVARWNWDGSPDVTFGSGGVVTHGFGDVEFPYEQITDAVIQADHKIIAAGYRDEERALDEATSVVVRTNFLDRMHPDGSPDTSFGDGGRFVFNESGPEVFSIAIDPSDRIVAAGRNVHALWATRLLNDVAFDGLRFTDDDLNQFEGDIAWLAAEGTTAGCNPPANTHYCPEQPVTRGEMAAFLVRALHLTDSGTGDLFTDDDTSVFEGDIDRLVTAGITRGCNPPENSHYCPDQPVSRGEMAAFLVRALGLTDPGSGDLFSDDDTSVFAGDIDRLATASITRGCNPPANTHYCPDDDVTRGQAAAFLHRALG